MTETQQSRAGNVRLPARHRGRGVVVLCGLALIAWGVSPDRAGAQSEDECIRDQFQVQVVDQDLVAFGSGTSRSVVLAADEWVEGRHASGCVAAVTTNRRFLFTSSRLRDVWYSADLELNERPVAEPLMGNTIVALVTNRRFFGFDGINGELASAALRTRESIVRTEAGANIAVTVTDQRLLGFALGQPSISEFPLQLREDIERVEATSDVVTVWTSRRILYLGTGGGGWSERARRLR